MALEFTFPRDSRPDGQAARGLLAGCAHYSKADLPLFTAGYNELCRIDLNGRRVLEVCCGQGELVRELARAFPRVEIIGMDRYPSAGSAFRGSEREPGQANARYCCGDALQLTEFGDESLDLVYGQATLHHLAHDTEAVGREFSRVLKPGGRLVFIYEPLGHNPVWAMIRAYRIARVCMVDESNVVLPQLEEIGRHFARGKVQFFNFLGYPFKSLGRMAGPGVFNLVYRFDGSIMDRWRGLAPLAANFNVTFTKG